jgi:hypothetical protein
MTIVAPPGALASGHVFALPVVREITPAPAPAGGSAW